jgi:hypothetical protein
MAKVKKTTKEDCKKMLERFYTETQKQINKGKYLEGIRTFLSLSSTDISEPDMLAGKIPVEARAELAAENSMRVWMAMQDRAKLPEELGIFLQFLLTSFFDRCRDEGMNPDKRMAIECFKELESIGYITNSSL